MSHRWRSLKQWGGGVALCSIGCQVTEIEIERSGSAVIPSAGITDEFVMDNLSDMDFVLEEFSDLGVEREDLSKAHLSGLEVAILSPGGVDFSFADRIEVFADAPDLGRVRIAYQDTFPVGAPSIAFDLDGADLREYLASESFSIVAVFDGGSPQQNIEVQGTATITVGVTVAGACNYLEERRR